MPGPARSLRAVTTTPSPSPSPPSARTTVRRNPHRAVYDRAAALAVLREGLVAHVGLATEAGPVVIPMLYALDGDRVLLHGSVASRLLRGAAEADVCVAVTLVDGLVLARSAYHHSMDYRSVVLFGRAVRVDDLDERRAALDRFVEHVVPGRTRDARPPSEVELRRTMVLALPVDECSLKVRTGGPVDEDVDLDLPVWAGVVPLATVAGAPVPADDLVPGVPVPDYARAWARPAAAP